MWDKFWVRPKAATKARDDAGDRGDAVFPVKFSKSPNGIDLSFMPGVSVPEFFEVLGIIHWGVLE